MLKKELTRNTRLHKRPYDTAACSVGAITPGPGNSRFGFWALVAGLGLFARILYNVFIDILRKKMPEIFLNRCGQLLVPDDE